MRALWGGTTALAVLLALTGCFGAPSGEGTKTAPPASGTPTPAPSGEDAVTPLVTVLPPDCLTLVSQADASTFGATSLNDPVYNDLGPTGVHVPAPPPANANPIQTIRSLAELTCLWADANVDVTHLRVDVGHVPADVSAAMITTLQGEGYACEAANGGTQCSITTPNSQFPVDDNFTYLVRDDVVISVSQTNFPTNNLMGSMVAEIWG